MTRTRRWTRLLASTMVSVIVGTGCASSAASSTKPTAHSVQDPTTYWSRSRLLSATPLVDPGGDNTLDDSTGPMRVDADDEDDVASLRVGALFSHDPSGNHFCTASVVASPGDDLLMTAAHCLETVGVGYDADIVFIPAYRDGRAPFGVWKPAKLLVPSRWIEYADPNFDFGFIVLEPQAGRKIARVLGANRLVTDARPPFTVQVTGYPASTEGPVTCRNEATSFHRTQLRFACRGLPEGTSGGPWVTDIDRRTHRGDLVGIIGGYEQGGTTDSVSYSVHFGAAVRALYDRAVVAEKLIGAEADRSGRG